MNSLLLIAVSLLLLITNAIASEKETEKWKGVDEAIIEKIAKEQGVEAKEPLINIEGGDLQLFFFLTAGALGGFVAGYYWRTITETRHSDSLKKPKEA